MFDLSLPIHPTTGPTHFVLGTSINDVDPHHPFTLTLSYRAPADLMSGRAAPLILCHAPVLHALGHWSQQACLIHAQIAAAIAEEVLEHRQGCEKLCRNRFLGFRYPKRDAAIELAARETRKLLRGPR